MSDSNIQAAADRLWSAEATFTECEPIRDILGETNTDAAYAAQTINKNRRLADGARIVGYKIGLTSASVQAQFGVFQPDYGHLYDDREVAHGGQLSVQAIMQPRAETEVALILGQDLPQAEVSFEEFVAAIEYAAPSIELVGSRIRGWDIRITDTIADNASASHFVLGPDRVPLTDIDLQTLTVTLQQNGSLVSEGRGSDCMGHPLKAGHWLALEMTHRGASLKKGDLILTGAIGKMVPAKAGDHFVANFGALGSVSVGFVA